MRLLVTGCGRSGTTWLARALRAAGVPAWHERAYSLTRSGQGGWAAEVSWLAAPHRPPSGTYVVHFVRRPLATIASQAARGGLARSAGHPLRAYDDYIYRHLPAVRDGGTQLDRCARFWVGWNELVNADERLRLEGITAADVTRLAQLVYPAAWLGRLPPPAHTSAAAPPPLSWADLVHIPEVAKLAAAYGYETED